MELVDYVANTPQNTNKTILKQLVNSEKNKAVYESVEELKRDGGIGWDEKPEKVIAEFDLIEVDGFTRWEELNTSIRLVAGQTYIVKTDTATYTDVCETRNLEGKNVFFIGNPAIFGEDNNGKSYGVFLVYVDDTWLAGAMDMNCSSHMTISIPGTIHPIDPKYIPYTVVDISDIAERFNKQNFTAEIDMERLAAIEQGIEQNNLMFVSKTDLADGKQTISHLPVMISKASGINADDGKPYKVYYVAFNSLDVPFVNTIIFRVIITASNAELHVTVKTYYE